MGVGPRAPPSPPQPLGSPLSLRLSPQTRHGVTRTDDVRPHAQPRAALLRKWSPKAWPTVSVRRTRLPRLSQEGTGSHTRPDVPTPADDDTVTRLSVKQRRKRVVRAPLKSKTTATFSSELALPMALPRLRPETGLPPPAHTEPPASPGRDPHPDVHGPGSRVCRRHAVVRRPRRLRGPRQQPQGHAAAPVMT